MSGVNKETAHDDNINSREASSDGQKTNLRSDEIIKYIEIQVEPHILEDFQKTGAGEWIEEPESKNLFYLWRSTSKLAENEARNPSQVVESADIEVYFSHDGRFGE